MLTYDETIREMRMAEQRTDLPRVTMPGGIRLAENVRAQGLRPELVLGLLIVSNLCIGRGVLAIVTSILNGLHMKNSLHYTGCAFDLQVEPATERIWLATELPAHLGRDFDVIDETTHIHVEYQPHHGAVT